MDALFEDVAGVWQDLTATTGEYYSALGVTTDVAGQVSENVAVVNEFGTPESRAIGIFRQGAIDPSPEAGDTFTVKGKTWVVQAIAEEMTDDFFLAVFFA